MHPEDNCFIARSAVLKKKRVLNHHSKTHSLPRPLKWDCTARADNSSTRPFIVRHFLHPTLLPFPDFIPQSINALAHEFDLAAFSQSFFIGPSYRLIRLQFVLCLIYLGSLFNGPLYILVVSLALLTEGRTARDLPKQRWSKKKHCKS